MPCMPRLQAQNREQQELLRLEEDARRRAQERAQRQQEARELALLLAQMRGVFSVLGLEQAALELTLGALGPLAADELRAEASVRSKSAALDAAQNLGVVQAKGAAAAEEAGQGGGAVRAAQAVSDEAATAAGQGVGGDITGSLVGPVQQGNAPYTTPCQ